jgi:hypothetical protein
MTTHGVGLIPTHEGNHMTYVQQQMSSVGGGPYPTQEGGSPLAIPKRVGGVPTL